jgi:4-hydroxybenzoate polyprenyltransferase
MTLLEWLAFTSLWVAAAAAALGAASAHALGVPVDPATVTLAAAGTLVVYNVDRLRDTRNDRHTSPRRTAFVERWRSALLALAGVGALASAALAWRAGPGVLGVLAPVAALGLFHRRLKRHAWWKPFYVAGAWTAVAVGLPAVGSEAPRHVGWVTLVVAATILANVVASNLRDDEAPSARFGPGVPLRLARGLALAALAAALLAPTPVRPLFLVPLATLAALAPFHPGELYGLVTVDGALLLGALASLLV